MKAIIVILAAFAALANASAKTPDFHWISAAALTSNEVGDAYSMAIVRKWIEADIEENNLMSRTVLSTKLDPISDTQSRVVVATVKDGERVMELRFFVNVEVKNGAWVCKAVKQDGIASAPPAAPR